MPNGQRPAIGLLVFCPIKRPGHAINPAEIARIESRHIRKVAGNHTAGMAKLENHTGFCERGVVPRQTVLQKPKPKTQNSDSAGKDRVQWRTAFAGSRVTVTMFRDDAEAQ